MTASNYRRSVCCGLLMLAVVGRIEAIQVPWWLLTTGFIVTVAGSGVSGAFVYSKLDRQKPVKVNYPHFELYEIYTSVPESADQVKLRREKRKLAGLVNFMKTIDENFITPVNKISLGVRLMQEILKDEFAGVAKKEDIEYLKDLAKNHINEGDQKVSLLVKTYQEMKEQARKVKKLLKEYKEQH